MIQRLFEIILDRKAHPVVGSYTNQLLDAGGERITQKVGEESVELIIAAGSQGKQRIIEEASDLIYHLIVLLAHQGISLEEIENELALRHTQKTVPSEAESTFQE